MEQYNPPNEPIQLRGEFQVRKQESGESLDNFARSLRVLAARAFPDANQEILDILLVQQFTSGLRDAEMRSRLIMKRCETLQVALGAARLIEIAEREVKSKRSANILEVSAEAGTSAAQHQLSVEGPYRQR